MTNLVSEFNNIVRELTNIAEKTGYVSVCNRRYVLKKLKSYSYNINNMEIELRNKNKKINDINEELNNKNKKINDVNEELNDMNEEYENLKKSNDNLTLENTNMNMKNLLLSNKIDDLQKKLNSNIFNKEKIEYLQKNNNEQMKENNYKKLKISLLQEQINVLNKTMDNDKESYNTEISKLQNLKDTYALMYYELLIKNKNMELQLNEINNISKKRKIDDNI